MQNAPGGRVYLLFITGGMVRVRWRNMGFFLGERVYSMRLPSSSTRHAAFLFAVLILAIALWVLCIWLLMMVTVQLLDTLRFIVDLGAMY